MPLSEEYWRRQCFKLFYVLFISFGMPALIIGFFALDWRSTNRRICSGIVRRDRRNRSIRWSLYVLRAPGRLEELAAGPADRSRRDVVEKVKPLIRDSNFQIQETAIQVLGDWGSPEDAALGDLARDPFGVFVRPQVCKARGRSAASLRARCWWTFWAWATPSAPCGDRRFGPMRPPIERKGGGRRALAATAEIVHQRAICQALEQVERESRSSTRPPPPKSPIRHSRPPPSSVLAKIKP